MAKTAYLCVQRSPEMRPSMGEVFGLWFFKFSCSEKCSSRNVYELLSVWGIHGNIFTRMLLCFTVKHAVHTVHAPPFSIHTLHVSIIYIYILFLDVLPIFLTRSSTFVNGSYQGGALSWSRKWPCPAFGRAICTSLCKAIRMIMVHIFYAPLFSLYMIQSLLYGCFGSWKSSLGLYIYINLNTKIGTYGSYNMQSCTLSNGTSEQKICLSCC
jgi:hypothetical protein